MLNATLRPSAILLKLIVCTHLLALVVVWFSSLNWYWCLLIDALVVYSLCELVQRHWRVGTRHLSFQEGRWQLTQNSQQLLVDVRGEYYLSPWIIIVNFRDESGKKYSIVILPDAIERDQWRRLKVLLKSIPQVVADKA